MAAASLKFQQTGGLEKPFVRLDTEPPADARTGEAEEAAGRRPYITSVCALFLIHCLGRLGDVLNASESHLVEVCDEAVAVEMDVMPNSLEIPASWIKAQKVAHQRAD